MLSFIDLFCGAGGWSTGLKAAGLKHLLGIDMDAQAMATYKANHNHGLLADIEKVTRADLPANADVLVASPPCQSFSLAGKRGEEGGKLCFVVVKIARWLQPRIVIIENVPGFLSKGKVHVELVRQLKSAGYSVLTMTLDAMLYEVPQRRKRVFVVACRPQINFQIPKPVATFDPSLHKLLQNVRKVPEFHWMTPEKTQYYKERHRRLGYVKFISPEDKQYVSNTVRASYMKSRGAEALILYRDSRCRMLTESECAAVQSFPKNFVWRGTRSAVYKQIGNAVPPKMAYHLGLAVKKALR